VRRSGVGRTEVAAALSGGAVGVARCKVGEGSQAGEDLVAEVEEARGGGGAGGGGDDAAVGVLPGGLAAGALVLDEDVRRTHRLPHGRRHGFSAASLSLWADWLCAVASVLQNEGVLPLSCRLHWEERYFSEDHFSLLEF
jgi:hypothetical protein